MQPKPEHDLSKRCSNRGRRGKASSLPYTPLVGRNALAPQSTRDELFQKSSNLQCVNRVKSKRKKKVVDYPDSSLCSDSYAIQTLQTRRERDGLLQLIWSEDDEFSPSRTTGNEQVPEIRVRNEDCEKEEGAFIFASLFHQGLTC